MDEKQQSTTTGENDSMSLENSSASTLDVQDVIVPGHEEGLAASPAVAAASARRKSISNAPFKKTPGYWRERLMVKPPVDGDPRERVSKLRKAAILAVVAQAGCLGGFSSTIYFPSLVQISKELDASQSAINVSVSLFILFMGIGPVLWATLSDGYKIRRIIYLVSTAIFCAASIGGGFATSAGGLTAARVFQAIGSSGPAMLGPGSVADIYVPTEQGTAMGLMFLGQFLGPVLGPPIGGVLAQAFGWQWTFWFMAIAAAAVFLQLFYIVPETYREEPKDVLAELDEKEQQQIVEKELEGKTKTKFPNPLLPIMLLRFPVIFLASLEVGMIFGLMFSIETISPVLFDHTYHLNESQTGATYIAAGVGSVIGAVIGGRMSDLWLIRGQRKRGGGELVLEDRLSPNIWISAFIIVPLGALMYGWSAEKHTTIALPIAGFGIYNFGMSQVMGAGSAYIVNAIPGQGSMATAASNFVRMGLACIFSLLVKNIVDGTSYGWYGVILAAINIFTMALFVIVKVHGAKMRADACRKLGL
ncbi:hypothetical protein BGZ96_002568 [Linnemannia gamsii]|uniref:Major facilitator superfamily (MFS) profile domain-containing protein n=1 Tax=Linnemannia gamsii TaxID=64522 RepID=A0ABQ7K9K8_9FUNG|nr:hypothetical protein BGZ96_002568 [Linnemannia gamsii]